MRLRRAQRAPSDMGPALAYLVPAAAKARALSHNYIGTKHVLLALLGRPSSAAVGALQELGIAPDDVRDRLLSKLGEPPQPRIDPEALATLGIDLDRVRGRIEDAFGRGALERAGPGCTSVCPRVKRALVYAVDEARGAPLGDDHVLVGLLAVEDSVAAGVLTEVGASLADVRDALEG
jgi:ATP-dependent Clp protease ATP-binding subunit ClpA